MITKTIKLRIEKTKTQVICYDLTTVQLVLGSKGIVGNLNYYNVRKDDKNRYLIPISFVKERIKTLENRVGKINESLSIMRQVVRK